MFSVIRWVSNLLGSFYLLTWNSVKVGYIPILRIKYIGEAMHFVVENLLSGRNRFPNIVYLKRKTSSSSLPTPPSPTNSRPRLDRCRLAYTMFCFILGTNGGFR